MGFPIIRIFLWPFSKNCYNYRICHGILCLHVLLLLPALKEEKMSFSIPSLSLDLSCPFSRNGWQGPFPSLLIAHNNAVDLFYAAITADLLNDFDQGSLLAVFLGYLLEPLTDIMEQLVILIQFPCQTKHKCNPIFLSTRILSSSKCPF